MLAFCQIYSRKIACHNLKPENLMLNAGWHLEIMDFGLAKKLAGSRTWTLCGTPDYLAPEVILSEGHDWAVDYWALGVPLYKMTAGTPPFWAKHPMEAHEKIPVGHVSVPAHFGCSPGELNKKMFKTHHPGAQSEPRRGAVPSSRRSGS